MPRTILTDEYWEKLLKLMLYTGRVYNKPEHRKTFEGILYRMRVGCPWRDIPEYFGDWSAVYRRFNLWSKKGRHNERNRAIFHLSFLAGLRACEISALKISDVVDNNYKVKSQILLHATQTKGSKSNRIIVSVALQKALQRYIDVVCASKRQDLPLIQSQKGNSFSPLTIVQLFAKFYAKAGISGASSHSGRRQFITALAENQINIRVIQALARHRHVNTTMRYIDINDVKLHNAVEAVTV